MPCVDAKIGDVPDRADLVTGFLLSLVTHGHYEDFTGALYSVHV